MVFIFWELIILSYNSTSTNFLRLMTRHWFLNILQPVLSLAGADLRVFYNSHQYGKLTFFQYEIWNSITKTLLHTLSVAFACFIKQHSYSTYIVLKFHLCLADAHSLWWTEEHIFALYCIFAACRIAPCLCRARAECPAEGQGPQFAEPGTKF